MAHCVFEGLLRRKMNRMGEGDHSPLLCSSEVSMPMGLCVVCIGVETKYVTVAVCVCERACTCLLACLCVCMCMRTAVWLSVIFEHGYM